MEPKNRWKQQKHTHTHTHPLPNTPSIFLASVNSKRTTWNNRDLRLLKTSKVWQSMHLCPHISQRCHKSSGSLSTSSLQHHGCEMNWPSDASDGIKSLEDKTMGVFFSKIYQVQDFGSQNQDFSTSTEKFS